MCEYIHKILPATLRDSAIPRSRLDKDKSVCKHNIKNYLKIIQNKSKSNGFRNLPNQSVGEILQVSEIRLRRTDTTLDLSQKAEKV